MEANRFFGLNCCTTPGLLTAAGAETVHDTTATINYVLNGKLEQKTAITDGATPATDYVTGLALTLTANQGAIAVWGLIAGGTVKVIFSKVHGLDSSGNFLAPAQEASAGVRSGVPDWPYIPDAFVPFAYQVLKAGSTAGTITFGVGGSNWNATGFTNVIQDVMGLPSRPQSS